MEMKEEEGEEEKKKESSILVTGLVMDWTILLLETREEKQFKRRLKIMNAPARKLSVLANEL